MSGFGYFLSFLTALAIGLVARAALFTAPDVCTRRLKFACTSCGPTSFLLCCLYGRCGIWTRSGHRLCLLCRSWIWEAFRVCWVCMAGVRVSGFSAAQDCAAVSWHGVSVLKPPYDRLEQKPDVLTTWRPPIVRTAARNYNKASRGNAKREPLAGLKDERSKYHLDPSFSTCFRQGSEQADSVSSEDSVSCQHDNSLRKNICLAWTFASDLSDFALFCRAACPELRGSSTASAGSGSAWAAAALLPWQSLCFSEIRFGPISPGSMLDESCRQETCCLDDTKLFSRKGAVVSASSFIGWN